MNVGGYELCIQCCEILSADGSCPYCQLSKRLAPTDGEQTLEERVATLEAAVEVLLTERIIDMGKTKLLRRYFVSMYTDGPSTCWNVIDRQTQEWVRRFPTETEAREYANNLEVANDQRRCTG